MQLFINDQFEMRDEYIYIQDSEIISQLVKVLRAGIGYNFFVQRRNILWLQDYYRYKCTITEIQKSQIISHISQKMEISNQKINKNNKITVAIPLLNKWEKYDLVVQKLSEIWVDNIVFWNSERSVIKDLWNNKISRFDKIAQEAVEQSWWWQIPNISYHKDLRKYLQNSKYDNIYIADYDGKNIYDITIESWDIIYIVWPEWWFTKNEIDKFDNLWSDRVVLGDNVLRSETAAILGSRWFANLINNNI